MITFVKHALVKAQNHVRNDLLIRSMNEEYVFHIIVTSGNRKGYITNIGLDELTAEFGSTEDSDSIKIKYSDLSNRDFIISYGNLYESFIYKSLASYYFFHRKPIIRFRRLIRNTQNNILKILSVKKTDLDATVSILVEKAGKANYGKPYIDEEDLLKIFNPSIESLYDLRIGKVDHNEYEATKAHYRLILEALVESGDVEPEGMGYIIRPKIFLTYQKMRSETKKHIQVLSVTAIATVATCVAAIAAVASAYFAFISQSL
ncbi:hypothetical protein [Vibrio sp. B1FLJ16]|uniref:hypothetical protein n=1 Tax=Vibrio sp. B1FLJ16 TaxID=2751178 RepID=UPI0015F3F42B|nr:hypothetical protein [Vibrio sp. B1FLJ16]CAD7818418.1 hypothetical protein ACOMICROBIO_EPCKBFOG_03370 [Vibrio sp. B1FLJ16]CAE6934486.1 hypothetical protein ACOMICROBIO_EPCKBFOG_03370 [Vibrio sp. B1FLJ16]